MHVVTIYVMGFGTPGAIWVITVEDFPAVVTMDLHEKSLHAEIEANSGEALAKPTKV